MPKIIARFAFFAVFLLSMAAGLGAAPLFPASCAHDACATQLTERVVYKHHRKVQKYPPVELGQCPSGQMSDNNGNCVPAGAKHRKTAMPPVDQCPEGQNMDPNSGICFSCSHNDHFENGRCVPCQEGFHVSGDECISD